MTPGLVVKLRPTGPWRSGPDSGARDAVDAIYHSDSVYSAVTWAMARLGGLEEWLEATARNPDGPAVCFSSFFPSEGDIGYVVPPRSIWPPAGGAAAARVRWAGARFVPLGLVGALLSGHQLVDEQWTVDGLSQCLTPVGRSGPFRTAIRSAAAVDRLTGRSEPHATACLEFVPGAGLWAAVSFAGEEAFSRWGGPVRGALRLLADSGFGGERSRGWGRAGEPEFLEGTLPDMILAASPSPAPDGEANGTAYWLLSLFVPGAGDRVDWERGTYSLLTRGGRVESPVRSGDLKKQVSMIAEGSVLVAAGPPRGAAPDVAPEGFAHPVFRSGFAVAIPLPGQQGVV